MPRSQARTWLFTSRFRKGAFGWKGSKTAVERIAQAVAEIKKAARTDRVAAAEGAITLIERLSPALEHVDSSSGALGSAVNWAIAEMVPLIGGAPVDETTRRCWLERLWEAFVADQIPYIELLGDYWGELCAMPKLASEWAERLTSGVLESFRPDRRVGGGFFHGTMACFSALIAAQRTDALLELIERSPRKWWEYRRWGVRALLAQGKRAEALRYAEASRDGTRNDDLSIARACEAILLESGFPEEAYNRYAIAASAHEPTYIARYRELARKYPLKPPAELLRDLIVTTPGSEGKWFAAAKSAGLFDEAIELARSTPCDPKTLSRAARDFGEKRPAFACEAALVALHWFAEGVGYEITGYDVVDAFHRGLAAAERLNEVDAYTARVAAVMASGNAFVREALRPALR
ncbi:MAG: DUF3579 domain-containing protein [Candidatus Eremiobacteraeota bacterium]|nr:DUF3579 domain-containing protein [Candidatus Eremiobacteraeota bacterium]